ncbi:serine/threonine protein kinase [Fusarium austroafricanum]|uniref:Serine/threonine protein kinase n=1 Tax=Fusarium austroafricanum TaxID=2364996 RepID=A0A8H4P016_9HYPO|nr:serine/threonine protein kinase [Fusarium austroafricanum]
MGQWWVDSRIEATVTRSYVASQLLPDEIERLDRPVAFGGEDLTERTYWESIRNDAPRLFLILVDLGVPDQIFGVVDDGWDDAELPIALEDVDRLLLTATRDERVEKKFYQRQFHYLLKPLQRGSHVSYKDSEVVPLDVVEKPSLPTHKSHGNDKVKLPNVAGEVFYRRRYVLGNGPGAILLQDFLDAVHGVKGLQNEHMVSYWASYTQYGFGYVLFTPAGDLTLKSFLATTPSQFKHLAKARRRELVMNWILCLVDTLCDFHGKNQSHGYIKPTTIFFTSQNHVFFSDSTRLTPDNVILHTDKSSFDRERYDYAAPELWSRPAGATSPSNKFPPGDEGHFGMVQTYDPSGSPTTMFIAPNPQLSGQQADIFSLGCIILELLSFLVKRTTSKFATFRSAKHKTAGRGGAVLDTSFHKNLGQVEAWMSGLAKDASRKSSSSKDGANILKGVTPMLHVVTDMLAMNPYDRPPAIEVQQRIYQILTEVCGITEPHCVHQYSQDLEASFGGLQIQCVGNGMTGISPPVAGSSTSYGTPRTYEHSRNSSSGGYSQVSRTTGSSEADMDAIHSVGSVGLQQIRTQGSWPRNVAYTQHASVAQYPMGQWDTT